MTTDPLHIGPELGKIRASRMCMWLVGLCYVPMMLMTFKWTHSDKALAVVFVIWIVFLVRAVINVAFATCPRCGNYFHMKNFFPNYLLRRCVHCGLHINADKTNKATSA
jgi:Zn ribbon nucleic-acid-binding protein